MRGVDTNLLIRFFTRDEPRQFARVNALFERAEDAGERFYISTPVLCELVWTLRLGLYGWSRTELSSLIDLLLGTPLFEIQDRELVRRALADFRRGRAGFADYLLGWQNHAAGCVDTVTFDRDLRGHQLFSVLRSPPGASGGVD
ncbi:MAG TPA: type II toxin-antitoxin system VapC family toxin [Thermoanaerobaculia bacterium]|nr:type II toxin-antitoxin system VapC family toxin [Thermoanaerobaculia bacterium]